MKILHVVSCDYTCLISLLPPIHNRRSNQVQQSYLIYPNDPFVSRALPKLITPPHTASSVKKHICEIEGLSGAESSRLFESLSSRGAAAESSKLAVKGDSGLGLSKDDPIFLVVGVEDVIFLCIFVKPLRKLRKIPNQEIAKEKKT